MSTNKLDDVLATPRLDEVDFVDVASSPERAWRAIRHGDLGARSPWIRALFALRTLPGRLGPGHADEELRLDLDGLSSTPEHPGFQILSDDAPNEVVVGAIGRVWQADIPFVHVSGPAEYASFSTPGYVKVAWAVRVTPRGEDGARLTVEVRVDATDEQAWRKFRRYFRAIGPASHFIRRMLLADLARELGTVDGSEELYLLPGDFLLPDASAQVTQGITIQAPPERVWPWLLQMGCGRAGFYSIDLLDNRGTRSAREVHPDLQNVALGDVLPATGRGDAGFEVLALEPNAHLVLGGLFDSARQRQHAFRAPRPQAFWQVTWAFVLERIDAGSTRLHVRARASFAPSQTLHAAYIKPVHHVMQGVQLRNLAARAEGRLPRDDWRDVLTGIGGAAVMAAAYLTPFLRSERSHWGVDAETAARTYPGDELIVAPRWGWTHGIEIAAPAEEVWPWIAQIGADRAGFYSYQWLENVAGCELRNAESIHPQWEVRPGDRMVLHPDMPGLPIAAVVPGRYFVVQAEPDRTSGALAAPWVATTWLFFLEPLGPRRCRFISRYRCDTSDDVRTRLGFGQTLVEPIGFAMDRRMLLGVKERAERTASAVLAGGGPPTRLGEPRRDGPRAAP